MRTEIKLLAGKIQPLDEVEANHIAFVKEWIDSGAEIFRIEKPATPDTHLVAYFLLIDESEQKLLLVEHKKANLWLPAGGHVEPNEHPRETVAREIVEELGIKADFAFEAPFFLTVTQTVGNESRHTDVSFWYILRAGMTDPMQYDEREFHSIRWFSKDAIPFDQSDPHMKRLIQKLTLHKILAAG